MERCAAAWITHSLGTNTPAVPPWLGDTSLLASSLSRQPAQPQMAFLVSKGEAPNGLTVKNTPGWTHTAILVLCSLETLRLHVQTLPTLYAN